MKFERQVKRKGFDGMWVDMRTEKDTKLNYPEVEKLKKFKSCPQKRKAGL